jgi:coenzyme PQQ precursor peptide PqqA
MALPSHIVAWLPLEARPLRPAQPPVRGAFLHPASGRPFCVETGKKARVAESTRHVPHQRDPQTRRKNDAMAWSTPEVREVCVGMEVTSYLSAEM